MRKTWWSAIRVIIIAVLGLLSVVIIVQTNQMIRCNGEVGDLYQDETSVLFEYQRSLNWMHYLHTLTVEKFVQNDSRRAIEYRDSAREQWDKIGASEQKLNNVSRNIRLKKNECNEIAMSLTKIVSISFMGYLVLLYVALIIYTKTKT